MNDCENIWLRIVANSNKLVLETKRKRRLRYEVKGDIVLWIPMETTMNNLFPQSKQNICNCINSRNNNLNPGGYPGTAQSYKWALLNHPNIWML